MLSDASSIVCDVETEVNSSESDTVSVPDPYCRLKDELRTSIEDSGECSDDVETKLDMSVDSIEVPTRFIEVGEDAIEAIDPGPLTRELAAIDVSVFDIAASELERLFSSVEDCGRLTETCDDAVRILDPIAFTIGIEDVAGAPNDSSECVWLDETSTSDDPESLANELVEKASAADTAVVAAEVKLSDEVSRVDSVATVKRLYIVLLVSILGRDSDPDCDSELNAPNDGEDRFSTLEDV